METASLDLDWVRARLECDPDHTLRVFSTRLKADAEQWRQATAGSFSAAEKSGSFMLTKHDPKMPLSPPDLRLQNAWRRVEFKSGVIVGTVKVRALWSKPLSNLLPG